MIAPTTAPLHETISALYAALSAFQAEMPLVNKGQTATIPGKDGRTGYSYRYADLADVSAAATPILTRHGLAFTCLPTQTQGGGYELVGRITHKDGGHIEGSLPISGRQAQEIGSSLTYLRRYLFGCLTGLVTDEDDDGARANQAQAQTQVDRRPAARRAWAHAQDTTNLTDVQAIWTEANAQGLLGVEIEHMDGATEPLGHALRRYGDALATTQEQQS